jgi:hypothetical protein
MKHYVILSLSAAVVFALSFACKKKESHPKVTITIDSPVNGSIYHGGDTVHIHAHITADQEIHGWELSIVRLANNQLFFDAHVHEHGKVYTLDTFWVNHVTMHSDMVLKLSAVLDHEGKTESKTINFPCHPM